MQQPVQSLSRQSWLRRFSLAGFLLVITASFLFGFSHQLRAAVYVPPTSAPPTGSLGLPLNITASFQSKEGALTLSNGLTVASPTGNPNLEVFGRINWNGTILSDWPSGTASAADYISITSGPDQVGWMSVTGQAATVSPAGLWTKTALPTTTTPTYAIWGVSDSNAVAPGVNTYGVYAVAGANSASNYALYGNGPALTSWAGYFAGHVTILPPYDLMVGNGSLAQGPNGTTGELCINDVCRSNWPVTFDSYWNDTGTSLEVSDTTRNLAVGGNDASAQFFIEKIPATSSVIVTANGTGSSNFVVVQ